LAGAPNKTVNPEARAAHSKAFRLVVHELGRRSQHRYGRGISISCAILHHLRHDQ
jgi:hypothetical protein